MRWTSDQDEKCGKEPRLTYDPELQALSPFCIDLYTVQAVRK